MDISFAIVAGFVGLIVLALLAGAVYSVVRWIFAENDPVAEKQRDEYFLDEVKARVLNINLRND